MSEVLIIDDEERTMATVRRLKLIHQLEVDVENDPTKAIDKIKSNKYKVVIFDIMMPVEEQTKAFEVPEVNNKFGLLTGAVLLYKLWKDPNYDIPFKAIFFSARDRSKIEEDLTKLGLTEGKHFVKYFQKPVNTSLLCKEINKYI